MRYSVFVCLGLFLAGCGTDSPNPPGAASLISPEQNSECTTGVSLNATTSRVEFRWQKAEHTETYELRVTNLLTNVSQTISTQALTANLPLEKGSPFSWLILTRNSNTQETAISPVWRFYNAGTESSYAPFPAEIISPNSGATVFHDLNNEVILEWSGADIDNDITGYELYLSTENPPAELYSQPSTGTTSVKVSVEINTVYYWKVVTLDSEGHRSDSGVYGFRVL